MRNKDRKTFKFNWHGNFITNCHVNTYGVAVRRNGDLGISSAREQFACFVFDDPDMDESEFVQRFDGGDEFHQFLADELYVCNDDDLLDRPGRDLADEIEMYFQQPAHCANATEMWLQEEAKKKAVFDLIKDTAKIAEKDPDHIMHMGPNDELINLSEHALGLIDQNIVDKISLNTYLDNMFK